NQRMAGEMAFEDRARGGDGRTGDDALFRRNEARDLIDHVEIFEAHASKPVRAPAARKGNLPPRRFSFLLYRLRRPRSRPSAEVAPFRPGCSGRLGGDEIVDALAQVLEHEILLGRRLALVDFLGPLLERQLDAE